MFLISSGLMLTFVNRRVVRNLIGEISLPYTYREIDGIALKTQVSKL